MPDPREHGSHSAPRTGPAMGVPPLAAQVAFASLIGTTIEWYDFLSSAPLVAITGSLYSVAAFVIVIAMVSFACSYLMTETLRSGLPAFPTPVRDVLVVSYASPADFSAAGFSGMSTHRQAHSISL